MRSGSASDNTLDLQARYASLVVTMKSAFRAVVLISIWCTFLSRLVAKPITAEPGPSSGSGKVVFVTPGAGKEITIEVDGSAQKQFRYCFADNIVILDPQRTRVDISYIQGLKITFKAVPVNQGNPHCHSAMEVTNISLLPLEALSGNKVPEQPSGPNEDALDSTGFNVRIAAVNFGKRVICIEAFNCLFYDRNLVLADADGKSVDISTVQKGMPVSFKGIWRRRGSRGDWPEERKLTKLVLTEFHAAQGTLSPANATPSISGITKAATPAPPSVTPTRRQGSTVAAKSKLPQAEQERLKRNHYATFFRDAVPGFSPNEDRGSSRQYKGDQESFTLEIREHEPGTPPRQAASAGKPFEKPTYASGNIQGCDFFATWSYGRVEVLLSVGPRYTVELKFQDFHGPSLDLSRPDVNAPEKINQFLAIWTQAVDLPRLAADAGWKNAPEPTPPDLLSRLPKSDPSKETDLDAVMRAVENEPQQVKDWVKKFYESAPSYNEKELYDRGKWALRATEQRMRDPYVDDAKTIWDMDYRGIEFRPGIEHYAYEHAMSMLRTSVPENRLEKVARLNGKLMVDKFVAEQNQSREKINESGPEDKAEHEARAVADKPPRSADESTPAGEKVTAKRPTPSPSPLAVAYADPEIQMEDLGPMPKDLKEVTVSADGLHAAAVIPSGESQLVYYDGKPGPEYDSIAHFFVSSPAVVFSKDGTHAAYLARRGESQFVWADGKETVLISRFFNSGDPGKISLGYDAVYFKFSPGGEHLAYVCETAGTFQQQIIIDGAQGPVFYRLQPIVFSEQGGHYACVAQPDRTSSVVVLDNTAGASFSKIKGVSLRLSRDGAHCAYIATNDPREESWVVVADGNQGQSYYGIESLQFGSNGRLAYVGGKDLGSDLNVLERYKRVVVLDGKELGRYFNVDQLQFSPDGNRLAYVAKTGDGVVAVVDGKQGRAYDVIQLNSLQFSPDSSSVTYYGKVGKDTFVVTDERESLPIGSVIKFTYAEKANTAAFIASKEPGFIAVVDNQPSKNYRFCNDVAVSPDGSRSAYAASASIGQPELVADGQRSKFNFGNFEEPLWGTDLKTVFRFSPDSRHLAVALDAPGGGGHSISVDGRIGPAFPECQGFVFSPDSAHFAYLGLERGPKGTTIKVVPDHKVVQTIGPLQIMGVFAANRGNQGARQLPPPDWRSFRADAAQPHWFSFRSDGKLKFLATNDGKIYRVTITPGPATGGPVIANTTAEAPLPRGKSSRQQTTSHTKVTSSNQQPAPESASQSPESQQPSESPADQPMVPNNANATDAATPAGAPYSQSAVNRSGRQRSSIGRAAPTEGGGADTSAVSEVAEQIAQGFSNGDIETLVSLYGEAVDYLDSGTVSSATVRSQLLEYFERWPVRQWTITGPVRVTSLGASRKQVTFTASYDASDTQTGRHSSGTAKETLVLAADSSGAMKIISHHEQLNASRGKSGKSNERRDRRERIYDARPVIPLPPNVPWPPGIPHP